MNEGSMGEFVSERESLASSAESAPEEDDRPSAVLFQSAVLRHIGFTNLYDTHAGREEFEIDARSMGEIEAFE
jgi:hypothetical protein